MSSRGLGLVLALGFAGALSACDLAALGDDPPAPGADASPPDARRDPIAPVGTDVDRWLSINELMAANAATLVDDQGAASTWIEIYNPTDQPVQLDGYALTDDLGEPRKAILSGYFGVPAHGHLVIWLDGGTGEGHAALRLDARGGLLALTRPDGSFIDRIEYGAQATDLSAAREPDGSERWVIEWHVSPGAANPGGAGPAREPEGDSAPPEAVPAAGDLTDRILGYDAMPELGLIVAPAEISALRSDPRTYVKAQLVYDGRTYGTVGLRLKGNNSFETIDHKPSLRISIDEYVDGARFFGLKDLTLNNMHSDFSMMHERLAYLIAREAGVPASRSNHAVVKINDQLYGLYANVETVKKSMLARWFDDPSGPLFEATNIDFEAANLPLYDLEAGPDDRSLIAGLDAALTLESPDEAIRAAADYADMPELLRFMAVCAVIAQLDSFPYSEPGDDIHLYADPASRRLVFMPWGMDETFYSSEYDVKNVHSVLARKCLASPGCFQRWTDQIWEVQAMVERMGIEDERQRIIAQIAPHVRADKRKPYTDAQVAEYQMNLFWFLSERRANLSTMLPSP